MYWIKLIFITILVSHLESVQCKVRQDDDAVINQGINPECVDNSLIEARGCRDGNRITINIVWTEFLKENLTIIDMLECSSEDQECKESCPFAKTNESFSVDLDNCSGLGSKYNLNTSHFRTSYYIEGSHMENLTNECSQMEKICVKSSCSLTNFAVDSFASNVTDSNINWDTSDVIKLNMSWDKIRGDENVSITLFINEDYDEASECFTVISQYNSTNHFLLWTDDRPLQPGCAYNIKIEPVSNQFYCGYTYIMPVCVGKNCDCDKVQPDPEILSVEKLDDGNFLIKWDPGQGTYYPYTIEEVYFEYNNSYGGGTLSPKVVDSNFTEPSLEVTMNLVEGEANTIKGTFINNFRCPRDVYYNYMVPKEARISSNIQIALIVFGVLVVFLLITWKYNTLKKYLYKVQTYAVSSQMNPEHYISAITPLQNRHIAMVTNDEYISADTEDHRDTDQFQFPKEKIIIKEIIGSGAFGQVYSAKAIGIGGTRGFKMVAVKTLGESEQVAREQLDDFLAEIEIFKKIGHHPNVVSLLGCCTLDVPYMMIMELVPCGDLKKYLVDLREEWLERRNHQFFFADDEVFTPPSTPGSPVSLTFTRFPSTSEAPSTPLEDPRTPFLADYSRSLKRALDPKELQNFAFQIAKGMAHLENIKITHRDLAARNILINQHKVLKISDFGLSRYGPYVNHRRKKIPLRWMAIEAIVDHKYDNKADVWSFGIVLWEIGTLGAFPYESVNDSFLQQFLQLGGRLERPVICTDEVYGLMRRCWDADPDERPTFKEMVDELDVEKRKIYVDFSQLNPMYVFPPSEVRPRREDCLRVVNTR